MSVPFTKLEVYLLAEKLADRLWGFVGAWNPLARDTVGKQLIRAVDSIGANIAEGSGRHTFADNKRFVYIARGSLCETRHWLRCAYRRKLLDATASAELKTILDELAPRLNAYIKSIGKSRPQPQSTPQQPITNNQ